MTIYATEYVKICGLFTTLRSTRLSATTELAAEARLTELVIKFAALGR
jgi:hypothetical protein